MRQLSHRKWLAQCPPASESFITSLSYHRLRLTNPFTLNMQPLHVDNRCELFKSVDFPSLGCTYICTYHSLLWSKVGLPSTYWPNNMRNNGSQLGLVVIAASNDLRSTVGAQKLIPQNMALWHAELRKQSHDFPDPPPNPSLSQSSQSREWGHSLKFPYLPRNQNPREEHKCLPPFPEISLTRED